jgi:hypothetical protein
MITLSILRVSNLLHKARRNYIRSGDRIPLGSKCSAPVQIGLEATQPCIWLFYLLPMFWIYYIKPEVIKYGPCKTWVCSRSPAAITGSNPAGGRECLSVVSVVCLSGRGLCDGLITRPEESYRLCCVIVCDQMQ